MVVAILEWIFIVPLVFMLLLYPFSFLELKIKKYPLEEIINIYNLVTILKQKYILNYLENFDIKPLNFILYFLPGRIKINVKYIFPIRIIKNGTLILPLPLSARFKLIDKYGKLINISKCNDIIFNLTILELNRTGFVCINQSANLFFDSNGNLIPFQKNNSKICLYTNNNYIFATNASFPIKFFFYNITFKYANSRKVNETQLSWIKIYTNYTGLAYLIIGEGENYTYCNCSNLKEAKYFVPIELLKLRTLESISGEKIYTIPIKYKDFYILIEILK